LPGQAQITEHFLKYPIKQNKETRFVKTQQLIRFSYYIVPGPTPHPETQLCWFLRCLHQLSSRANPVNFPPKCGKAANVMAKVSIVAIMASLVPEKVFCKRRCKVLGSARRHDAFE
jgi:hypothetical protein